MEESAIVRDPNGAIRTLEEQLAAAINGCGLPVAVIRLVLMEMTNNILDMERREREEGKNV